MNDKDVAGVLSHIAPLVDVWLLATLPPPRGLAAQALGPLVAAAGGREIREFASVAAACAAARDLASPGDRVIVFGSFLTVGPGLAAAATE
jgi:dihydrofolate synthase/folylpolyglutamate synthase